MNLFDDLNGLSESRTFVLASIRCLRSGMHQAAIACAILAFYKAYTERQK